MRLLISTYAYIWRRSDLVERPMTLDDVLRDAVDLGVDGVQIADAPELDADDDIELRALRRTAERLGLVVETGTRGLEADHLSRYLAISQTLGSTMLRSMFSSIRGTPTFDDARASLREVAPRFEEAGVTLALETYEQITSERLRDLVTSTGSPAVGICLDPGNCVASLEKPADVVDVCAPLTVNLHVKDFAFSRSHLGVGFTLAGTKLGTGLLDYPAMSAAVDAGAAARGLEVSRVVEHWMPPADDPASTAASEAEWVAESVAYLRAQHADDGKGTNDA